MWILKEQAYIIKNHNNNNRFEPKKETKEINLKIKKYIVHSYFDLHMLWNKIWNAEYGSIKLVRHWTLNNIYTHMYYKIYIIAFFNFKKYENIIKIVIKEQSLIFIGLYVNYWNKTVTCITQLEFEKKLRNGHSRIVVSK